jgi:DnaJ-class molecular chaperone
MSDSNRDYYDVLGLAKGAGAQEVRAAYRRLAKRHHPDAQKGDAGRFHAISHAHAMLVKTIGQPLPKARDNLVSRFWKLAKAPAPCPVPVPVCGANIEANLLLSLEDALKGAVRRVTLPSGKALDVHCPAGCATGDIIRLKGAGCVGLHGAKNGDALIRIKLLSHKRATLKDRDLHMPLWLEAAQLRNGTQIEVSTPHGPLKVKIPPLARQGQSLRLKGRGLPAYQAKPAGHLYFMLHARKTVGFGEALGRFSRLWTNPLRQTT